MSGDLKNDAGPNVGQWLTLKYVDYLVFIHHKANYS